MDEIWMTAILKTVMLGLVLVFLGYVFSRFARYVLRQEEHPEKEEPSTQQFPKASDVEVGAVKLREGRDRAKDRLLSDRDMTISSEIDFLDDQEIPQGETQPIPKVGKDDEELRPGSDAHIPGHPKDEGAFGEGHGLYSFYRKLADPAQYPLKDIRKALPLSIMQGIDVEATRFYDTVTLDPRNPRYERELFMLPLGQAGKTNLDTNLHLSAVLVPHGAWELFVFHTILLEFLPRAVRPGDVNAVLDRGILDFESGMTHRSLIRTPLSDFSPLTLEENPRVFFSTGKPVLVKVVEYIRVRMTFPNEFPPLVGMEMKMKFSLVGLLVARSRKRERRS
jgi:hypothetical protein